MANVFHVVFSIGKRVVVRTGYEKGNTRKEHSMAGEDYFVVEYVHGCSLECDVKIETPGVCQKFVVQDFGFVGNGIDQKHLPLNG